MQLLGRQGWAPVISLGRMDALLGSTRTPELTRTLKLLSPLWCVSTPWASCELSPIPGFDQQPTRKHLATRAAWCVGSEVIEGLDLHISLEGVCLCVFTLLPASNKFNINLHFQGNN